MSKIAELRAEIKRLQGLPRTAAVDNRITELRRQITDLRLYGKKLKTWGGSG